MANPFKDFIKSYFGKDENITEEERKEMEEAEAAGNEAAERVEKKLVVEHVDVNSADAQAKASGKEDTTAEKTDDEPER